MNSVLHHSSFILYLLRCAHTFCFTVWNFPSLKQDFDPARSLTRVDLFVLSVYALSPLLPSSVSRMSCGHLGPE